MADRPIATLEWRELTIKESVTPDATRIADDQGNLFSSTRETLGPDRAQVGAQLRGRRTRSGITGIFFPSSIRSEVFPARFQPCPEPDGHNDPQSSAPQSLLIWRLRKAIARPSRDQ